MRTDRPFYISRGFGLVSSLGSVLYTLAPTAAIAQVTPDNTTASVAKTNSDVISITGGVRSGDTLFHSFDLFSIEAGRTAQFENALDLSALITRVTGTELSLINGKLGARGSADVFLLNPNGIVFGDAAELDVGGSFIATTADSVLFDDQQSFSAVRPQNSALLTVSAPVGLQYGTQPSGIEVLGNGSGFIIDPDTLATIPTRERFGLQVPEGNTLALLGGEIELEGGNLTTSGGRIVLFGAGSESTLSLEEDRLGWSVQQETVPSFRDVSLSSASSLFTSGKGGGAIQIEGQTIELLNGSTLLSNTFGENAGSGIDLRAAESINLLGVNRDLRTGEALFPTSIFSEVDIGATGDGGDVALAAPSITVADGAQVSTSVFDFGSGGNITVRGEDILLSGETSEFGPSGFFLSVADPFAEGDGGNFTLQANQLRIEEGAVIDGSTFGPGDSGEITIEAASMDLIGNPEQFETSGIFSQVEGEGNGGNINIQGDVLTIAAGANLSTTVFGQGDGGHISLLVDQIDVKDGTSEGALSPSGIFSSLEPDSTGQGGNITVRAQRLAITEGGAIDSSTASDQQAGELMIQAQSIDLIGVDDLPTGIFSAVFPDAMGAGGNISLQTETLSVQGGAQIVTGTFGQGRGSDLQITANDINLDGRNNSVRSGLFASALSDTGTGGSIQVNAGSLEIQNGATINAGNFPSVDSAIAPGEGAAGSIDITTNFTSLRNEGTITTSTFTGDGGNIRLESDAIVARNNSAIATNASRTATGGNITILSDAVVAVPRENSDITANAQQGQGGRVEITTRQIYGFAFSDRLTPNSDITASSEVGLNGEVVINQIEPNPSDDLGLLPYAFEDRSDQITAGCPANQGASFVATGRGGLPDDLSQQVQSFALLPAFERSAGERLIEDRERPTSLQDNPSTQEELQEDLPQRDTFLVEAQGWRRNPNGSVALVASADTLRSAQSVCLSGRAE